MLNNLLPNLQIIGILLVAYAAALGVNTILGIYYNIDVIKQQFSWKKFWSGIIRGGILLVAAALITVILSCLPSMLESFGITASNSLFEGLSIGAIATVMLSCIIYYLKDAINKFYNILQGKKEEKPVEEDNQEEVE